METFFNYLIKKIVTKTSDDILIHQKFFMRKSKVDKIKLLNEENDLEVTSDIINSYKTNTTRKRVTKRGLEKYYNNLIQFMNSRFI